MPRKYTPVPRKPAAVSDVGAARALGISRATFFRKLASGEISPPPPLAGTKRRWWTFGDLAIAREEIARSAAVEDNLG